MMHITCDVGHVEEVSKVEEGPLLVTAFCRPKFTKYNLKIRKDENYWEKTCGGLGWGLLMELPGAE